MNGFCTYAMLVHIVPYATDHGISSTGAASIISLIGVVAIFGRVMLGGIADRFGESHAFLFGFILKSAAMIWLLFAKELWMLYPFAVLLGLSYGIVTVGAPLIADIFGLKSHGAILGACAFGHSIGVAIGPLMAGYIFDLTDNYEIAFLILAVAAISGIFITLLLQSTQAKQGCIPVKD